MIRILIVLLAISNAIAAGANTDRPNIVFLLADDLGYTDIAPFGSEVSTPALSALADEGVRFANYHTAANCAPARAMLLTGVNNHRAGVANIPEMLAPEQRRHPSYQGVLGSDVVTVATLLEDAGYHTYMAGKWHLGATSDKLPSRRGFERTVALNGETYDAYVYGAREEGVTKRGLPLNGVTLDDQMAVNEDPFRRLTQDELDRLDASVTSVCSRPPTGNACAPFAKMSSM